MRHSQIPIDSGFNARTTADEVLAGRDLTGKCAIVTGGHSGIGLETTRALGRAGAKVWVGARRVAAARAVLGDMPGVDVNELDLADLQSVRGFAERFVTSKCHIDILVNCAGICVCPETRVGDGWEAQFAINHLGHYALVNHLWPALAAHGARVVAVSSDAHHGSSIRWDDVQFDKGYDKWQAYAQSKTANALFALHLDALGRDFGVRTFSVHPGEILTRIFRHLSKEEMAAAGGIDANGELTYPAFKTPQQGAATQVWAATSAQLEGRGGVYCRNCDIAPIAAEGKFVGVRDYAVDPDQAARLWRLSAQLTRVDAFAAGGRV